MITYIKNSNNEWVEGEPVLGELYRYEACKGSMHESIYNVEAEVLNINITSIDGAIQTNENFASNIIEQDSVFTVNGELQTPDRIFTLPIKNTSTGELLFFTAKVINGTFSVKIKLSKNSQYQYTNSECNLDLKPAMFNVLPMKFNVIKTIED